MTPYILSATVIGFAVWLLSRVIAIDVRPTEHTTVEQFRNLLTR